MRSLAVGEGARPLDRDEVELVLEGILATAGAGRYLVCGAGAAPLAASLVRRGLEATHQPSLPPPASSGAQASFDVAILWHALDALDPAACAAALRDLRPAIARAVVVRTDGSQRPRSHLGECWVEGPALESGYRKHPLYLQLTPYESRESAGAHELLLLEPIAAAVLERHPLASLRAERDLHMDMLRESGRRSDAHVERYRLALQFVRPGDTVLDVACGLGYGSRVLFAGSGAARVIGVDESASAVAYASDTYAIEGRIEFRRGDAQDLSFVADHSVDLVVSFETLEHLHEPLKLLDEARRVLRPGGRLVACVPNQWVDESGHDPNPHHHHVYSWDRLREEIGARFRVERAYRQVAGGGMVETQSGRSLREFAPEGEPGPAEWLIVAAMSDPVAGRAVPYVETTFTGYEDVAGFHVARFDRDYANPWLVKAMVSIGFRFGPGEGLRELAHEVAAAAGPGSADQGAALCVEAYALLEAGPAAASSRARIRGELETYVTRAGDQPHERRWAISCLYVLARLHLVDGAREEARKAFERCASIDPVPFSPLLATKTIDAAYLAGLLAALSDRPGQAREWWVRGVRTAREVFSADWANVIGREDHPLYFGLPEVASAVAKASRCAFALAALEDVRLRPGHFWVEVSRDFESQMEREMRRLRHTLHALEGATRHAVEASAGAAAAEELTAALDKQSDTILEMKRSFEAQAAAIQRMNGEFEKQNAKIALHHDVIAAKDAGLGQQAQEIARLVAAVRERDQALAEQAKTIEGMRAAFDEQARSIANFNKEIAARDAALAEQGRTIEGMRAGFAQQAANIEQLRSAARAAEERAKAAAEELARRKERRH